MAPVAAISNTKDTKSRIAPFWRRPPQEVNRIEQKLHQRRPNLPFKRLAARLPGVEGLAAGDLGMSVKLAQQEFLRTLIPKLLTLGALGAHGRMLHELFLELDEYFVAYGGPPLSGSLSAQQIARDFDLPHFELLAIPPRELESKLGQTITVGTLHPAQVEISEHLLNRIASAHLMNWLFATALPIAAEMTAPALGVLGTNWLFEHVFNKGGGANFYELSGLPVPEDAQDNDTALQKAWETLAVAGIVGGLSTPAILGASRMIGRSNANVPGARQLTKYLEMGRGFSISKISVASILGLGSIWAYLHNARNDAERAELYARLFVAVGMVLVFGDVIGNAATAFNLMRMGHGTRGMTGVRDMLSQMTKGQRPLFDFDTVGPLNRKPEAGKPQKGFFGRLGQAISGQRAWSDLFDNGLRGQFDVTSSTLLRENPGLQEALRSNPDLFERQVQKLHFCKHHMPQLMALPVGLGTMVLNYFLVTKTMYKAEYGGVPIASDPQKSEPTESMLKPQGLQSMAVAPSTSGQGSQAHS